MNQNVNIGRKVHFLPLGKLYKKPNYPQKVTLYIQNLNKTNELDNMANINTE